jgi:hypothetical protein
MAALTATNINDVLAVVIIFLDRYAGGKNLNDSLSVSK